MSKVIVSGEAHGSGSDRFRWVSYLSTEAKNALTNKTALVICERPFNDSLGEWYVVTENNGRYDHRLPTTEEQETINKYVGKLS